MANNSSALAQARALAHPFGGGHRSSGLSTSYHGWGGQPIGWGGELVGWGGQPAASNPGSTPAPASAPSGGASAGTPATRTPAAPAATAPAPAPNPYDSTYFDAVNGATTTANNQINGLNEQSGYGQIDLSNALAALAHQQPLDQQRLTDTLGRQNLLLSGHAGQDLGNLNYSYLTRQSADQNAFDRAQAARDNQIAGIQGGLRDFTSHQALLAAARASAAAQANPSLGESAAPLTGAPGGSAASVPGKPVRGGGRVRPSGVNALAQALALSRIFGAPKRSIERGPSVGFGRDKSFYPGIRRGF